MNKINIILNWCKVDDGIINIRNVPVWVAVIKLRVIQFPYSGLVDLSHFFSVPFSRHWIGPWYIGVQILIDSRESFGGATVRFPTSSVHYVNEQDEKHRMWRRGGGGGGGGGGEGRANAWQVGKILAPPHSFIAIHSKLPCFLLPPHNLWAVFPPFLRSWIRPRRMWRIVCWEKCECWRAWYGGRSLMKVG